MGEESTVLFMYHVFCTGLMSAGLDEMERMGK